jgi:hypothetical protein
MKPKFKLSREQVAGLADLTTTYIEQITWRDIRGAWLQQNLYALVDKLEAANRKMKFEGRRDCKISFSLTQAFAFELLYDQHPIEPTDHIDNTVLTILLSLKKHYT